MPIRLASLSLAVCIFSLTAQFSMGQEAPAKSTRAVSTAGPTTASSASNKSPNHRLLTRSLYMIPGNQPVIEELELMDYQLAQIEEIEIEFRKELNATVRELQRLTGPDRQAGFAELYGGLEDKLKEALLPKQYRRLRQLALQSFAVASSGDSPGNASLINHGLVLNELGLSEAAVAKMRRAIVDEQQRYQREVARLKKEMQEKILAVLTEQDRVKFDELLGESFDFQGYAPKRGGRFQPVDDDH